MGRIAFALTSVLAAAALGLAFLPSARAASQAHQSAASAASEVPATEPLGSAGAWSAYASHDTTGRVCYVAGHPERSGAAATARRQPMAMVTHRPAENISNVVSFVEGYTLKPGSGVVLEVGGRKFDLFTRDDSAWARTSELDRTIVAALGHAGNAVVKAEPEKGRPTVDVYSLSGFGRALALIDKACGVMRGSETAAPARAPAHRRHKPRPAHG